MLTRDPVNVEDCLKCDGDDPADSARYGLKSALEPGARAGGGLGGWTGNGAGSYFAGDLA